MKLMVEKRSSTHTVECYNEFGDIVGFVAPASRRLIDAIFTPSPDGLSDKQRADKARDAAFAAQDAERAAAQAAIQNEQRVALANRAADRQARVALVNAALEDLRADGLDVADQLGLVIDNHGGVAPANNHLKRRSDAAFKCYDRCAAEAVVDVDRAGDIYAEILGLID